MPDNCQREFGICDSDFTPAGYNMSAEAREPKGEINYSNFITRCEAPRSVALTFNDGPSNNSEELLDILRESNARATFFISGNTDGKGSIDTTSSWTNIIKRMIGEGHQVGSHTWSHLDMDTTGPDARKLDMVKNERALTNILGKYPTYMRAPYSHCTGACLNDMQDLGYHVILYSYDSGDAVLSEDLDEMKAGIDRAFDEQGSNGNLLLVQHETIHNSAIELTKHILQQAQQRGWDGMWLLSTYFRSKC